MTLLAVVALAFNGWMAWTLYGSLREKKPSGWVDYFSAVWIAAGSLCGMAVAIKAALF